MDTVKMLHLVQNPEAQSAIKLKGVSAMTRLPFNLMKDIHGETNLATEAFCFDLDADGKFINISPDLSFVHSFPEKERTLRRILRYDYTELLQIESDNIYAMRGRLYNPDSHFGSFAEPHEKAAWLSRLEMEEKSRERTISTLSRL